MKICIFSDVHGNIDALNEMLKRERERTDIFLFAGDIFGYFYNQHEILYELMSLENLFAVRGNHDSYFLRQKSSAALVDKYGSSYKYSILDKERKFLEDLPEIMELEIDENRFGIYHGGLEDYLEQRIYPDTEIDFETVNSKYEYLILGHTHYRFIRKEKDVVIINPGSLGQPRDGKGFGYCVLETNTGECEFSTVSVDKKKLLEEIYKKDYGRTVYYYLNEKYGDNKK